MPLDSRDLKNILICALSAVILYSFCFVGCSSQSEFDRYHTDVNELKTTAVDVSIYWNNEDNRYPSSLEELKSEFVGNLAKRYELIYIYSEKSSIFMLACVPRDCNSCGFSSDDVGIVQSLLKSRENEIKSIVEANPEILFGAHNEKVSRLRDFLPHMFSREVFCDSLKGFYLFAGRETGNILIDSTTLFLYAKPSSQSPLARVSPPNQK